MTMENIKHKYGEVRAIGKDVEETRTIEFVISDESRDRHGTILKADNWDLNKFNANGIVGYQHNVYGGGMCLAANPDDVIGIGKAWREGTQTIGSVTFEPKDINPLAEKIFRKVLHGTLKATSVGFYETKEGDFGEGDEARNKENQTYYYGAQELLEFSIVNIPSNANALKRTFRDQTSNALVFIKKQLGLKFSEIEEMKIKDVIDLIEKPEKKEADIKELEAVEIEQEFYKNKNKLRALQK